MNVTCLVHTYPHQGNYDEAPAKKWFEVLLIAYWLNYIMLIIINYLLNIIINIFTSTESSFCLTRCIFKDIRAVLANWSMPVAEKFWKVVTSDEFLPVLLSGFSERLNPLKLSTSIWATAYRNETLIFTQKWQCELCVCKHKLRFVWHFGISHLKTMNGNTQDERKF